MAFIRLINGKGLVVKNEQALEMWAVYNKEMEGNEKQQAFCKQIKMIHFNIKNAPDTWLNKHKTKTTH